MLAKISQIGNSKGVRIPKAVLEACNLDENDQVEISTEGNVICLTPLSNPRHQWEEGFRCLEKFGPESELEAFKTAETFDDEDWQW